jgi:hypothetical protein
VVHVTPGVYSEGVAGVGHPVCSIIVHLSMVFLSSNKTLLLIIAHENPH